MSFAPQRHALFRHPNLQRWSEPLVFLTFWLRNVLRATTACTFPTSQLPKVVRPWCALYILTWKCASRHNGVQFFISHLASWLRTLFTHLHRLSSYSFSSTLLSSNLSLLSASSLLCFSSVHIVGSLTSKLPSIIDYYTNSWISTTISWSILGCSMSGHGKQLRHCPSNDPVKFTMDFRRATGRHQPRMLALCRGTGYPAGNLQPLSCSWFTLVKPGKKELAELDMEKKGTLPPFILNSPETKPWWM